VSKKYLAVTRKLNDLAARPSRRSTFPHGTIVQIGRLRLDTSRWTVLWRNYPMRSGMELTDYEYAFLSRMIVKTDAKRASGMRDCSVSFDELLEDHMERPDTAIHVLKWRVCQKVMNVEETVYGEKMDRHIIVSTGRGQRAYLIVEH
jgi:hypothetical protein